MNTRPRKTRSQSDGASRNQTAFRGDRLYEARHIRGLTQNQLADKAGIKRTSITMLENGMAEGSSKTVASLAYVLNVSADWLLDLVDTPDGHRGSADDFAESFLTHIDSIEQQIKQLRKMVQP